jgi:hypothetical protein
LHDIVFPKTHDLEALLHLCIAAHPQFSSYKVHARELAPLAAEFRYPGDVLEPTGTRSRHVLLLAEEITDYCHKLVQAELARA